MIIGAGSAGSMLIKELKNHADMNMVPVVMVDDDKTKHGTTLNGVPVVAGREKIKEVAKRYKIDEIIVAIPSASRRENSRTATHKPGNEVQAQDIAQGT